MADTIITTNQPDSTIRRSIPSLRCEKGSTALLLHLHLALARAARHLADLLKVEALLQPPLHLRLERAGRADAHALPTEHARGLRQRLVLKRRDVRVEPPLAEVERKGELPIIRADL